LLSSHRAFLLKPAALVPPESRWSREMSLVGPQSGWRSLSDQEDFVEFRAFRTMKRLAGSGDRNGVENGRFRRQWR
jgi:hypothetical protein